MNLDDPMVCSLINERNKRLSIVERAALWGISPDRAIFLSRCATDAVGRGVKEAFERIQYDPLVLIAESARIGLSAADTAEMMGMPVAEVLATGYAFPAKSKHKRPPGFSRYSLFEASPHYFKTYGENYKIRSRGR